MSHLARRVRRIGRKDRSRLPLASDSLQEIPTASRKRSRFDASATSAEVAWRLILAHAGFDDFLPSSYSTGRVAITSTASDAIARASCDAHSCPQWVSTLLSQSIPQYNLGRSGELIPELVEAE